MAKFTDSLAQTAGSTRVRRTAPATDKTATRLLGSHVPEEVFRLFHSTRAELGLSAENAHAEALNCWFASHGKPTICAPKEYARKRKGEQE